MLKKKEKNLKRTIKKLRRKKKFISKKGKVIIILYNLKELINGLYEKYENRVKSFIIDVT
jgi:hypothetical protein